MMAGTLIRSRRFTLIEVLMASTLSAVIAVAIASLLGTLHHAEDRVRVRSDRRAFLGALERKMSRDLRALVPPGGLHASGLIGESTPDGMGGEQLASPEVLDKAKNATTPDGEPVPIDERDRLVLAVNPPARAFGEETPLGEGAMWEVIYEIDDDPETEERGLVRRIKRVRDPAVGSDEEPPEQIAEEVLAMDLAFFDGQDWVETWDSGASDTLPLAISVNLVVLVEGELVVYRVVVSPPTARPSQLVEASR